MNDIAEEVLALSDDDTVSATPAIVPKKRGRPAADKPKKVSSGRARGRPSKVLETGSPKKVIKADEASEVEDSVSDGDSPVPNGDANENLPRRGRQPKDKRKLTHTIVATGKGRGRPKKIFKPELGDDDEVVDDNDDIVSGDHKTDKKTIVNKGAKKARGRPKKVRNSDDSSDEKVDDEFIEKRSVGRPSSGAINLLNIVRTGRGQGRPKKSVVAKHTENGGAPRGRGRPSTSGKGPYVPTGKPRGRPKAIDRKYSQDEEEEEVITDENSTKDEIDEEDEADEVVKNSGSECEI